MHRNSAWKVAPIGRLARRTQRFFPLATLQVRQIVSALMICICATLYAQQAPSKRLDLDLRSLLMPIPASAKHSEPGYFIWDGSIVRGEDGKYNMFYSRWPVQDTFGAWVTRSEVVHAISNSPFGPFVFHDVALPPRGKTYWDGTSTHNPTVKRFGNKYYIYYNGDVGSGVLTNGHNNEQHDRFRIGVAVADNPNGPWERFDKPIIDTSSNEDALDSRYIMNPTVIRTPGKKYFMIYKGGGKEPGSPIVLLLATADSPVGPFKKELVSLFPVKGVQFAFEDPFLWYDAHRKMYFAILKDMKGYSVHTGKSTLVLFESKDARHWSLAKQPIVSELKLTWADGHVEPVRRMERPQLLFDRQGDAIALTTAILDMKGDSWNVTIPLKKDVEH